MRIEIASDDFWTMFLSTIRYSMGRRTYISSECLDLCRLYGSFLSKEQKNQVKDEVQKEINICVSLGKTLGDKCDHDSWVEIVKLFGEE